MEETIKARIHKVFREDVEEVEDTLIVEYPFTIYINDQEFITLLCSPTALEYLATGFLVSEGIIKEQSQIKQLKLDEKNGHAYIYLNNSNYFSEKLFGKRTVTTGCGKGTIFYNALHSLGTGKLQSNFNISAEKIYQLMEDFNHKSDLFKETGGVHSCGLFDEEGIILFHEDVGRHNALDKIIGEALIKDIELSNKILITSGRISSEMIIKTSKRSIPIVISRSAPTNLSYNIAQELGITLIGFARGKKLNLYHDENRVLFSEN
ncbi:formate dehydrogenase accessory sulfurtransferase FdhD [Alkaliphilus transvaalensis]|uniref:formate dehydrogenase accessory sulfurtransferase FdhD n=1 Tax=Alkaliphilus transvaalensis TaxID=114628 RepID=UPI000685E096|nr:formate dehydrogenase accessory sulfurtransferase FdhD [Alkaliphilus transvaalensis]